MVRHLIRSCLLVVVTTSLLLLLALMLGGVASLWEPTRPALQVLGLVLVGATPFVVVLMHFRWQTPRESSVLLAFITGGVSCALALFLVVIGALYLHGP